jgi:hypothetical protein
MDNLHTLPIAVVRAALEADYKEYYTVAETTATADIKPKSD